MRFAEADIFVVPTLSVIVSAADSIVAELVQETDEALLSPIQQQTLADRFAGGLAEALAAATSVAADAFGVADRGRIAAGHVADLVLVRADLEEDVSRSHDIVAIWKDGYLVERAGGSAGAAPQAGVAPAPAETLVADFEDGLRSGRRPP